MERGENSGGWSAQMHADGEELTHLSASLKSADLLGGLAMVPYCADPDVGNHLRYLSLWILRLAAYVLGLSRAGKGDRRGEGTIRKEVPFT